MKMTSGNREYLYVINKFPSLFCVLFLFLFFFVDLISREAIV